MSQTVRGIGRVSVPIFPFRHMKSLPSSLEVGDTIELIAQDKLRTVERQLPELLMEWSSS